MIIERTEAPGWTSNMYLIADGPGGHGVLVDGNGVEGDLVDRIKADGITITHHLLTHHHADHVQGVAELAAELGVPVVGSAATQELTGDLVTQVIADGETLTSGELTIEAWATPGHCRDHLVYVVNGTDVLTADVLFKGTLGGTRAPEHTTYADLKASVERLLTLPDETRVHPGHTLPTTIGAEREHNPFIRIWDGRDAEGDGQVTVWDQPATLVLWAPDYDGTNKAWIRWADGGDDIVGGSQVVRA